MHHDQDIALAMKRCEYIATVVGDLEFDDRRQSSEPVAHPLKQFWHPITRASAERERIRVPPQEVGHYLGISGIGLREHEELRNIVGTNVTEHRAHRSDTAFRVGITRVHQMHHEVRVADFLQGGTE